MVFTLEGWDLTLTVVGLGVASAAAVATLVDRFINPEQKWWWERIKLQTQTAPGEFKPLPFAATEEEEHSRTWGCPRYTITPEEIVRRRREGSVLPTI
jgi:hypothetical protein